jgi:hypothetical protein
MTPLHRPGSLVWINTLPTREDSVSISMRPSLCTFDLKEKKPKTARKTPFSNLLLKVSLLYSSKDVFNSITSWYIHIPLAQPSIWFSTISKRRLPIYLVLVMQSWTAYILLLMISWILHYFDSKQQEAQMQRYVIWNHRLFICLHSGSWFPVALLVDYYLSSARSHAKFCAVRLGDNRLDQRPTFSSIIMHKTMSPLLSMS